MASIINLLLIAVYLLSSVITNPNVDEEYKMHAIQVANKAIALAENRISIEGIDVSQETNPLLGNETPVNQPLPETQPVMEPVTEPVVEVKKDIVITTDNARINQNGRYYDVYVKYTENGKEKADVDIVLSSNDTGMFIGNGKSGNPLTISTKPGQGRNGEIGAQAQYLPKELGDRTITATVNGKTVSIISQGQVETE